MNSFQAGEMVQWVKAPVTKPNGLNLIPGTHPHSRRREQLLKFSWHMHAHNK